MTTINTQKVKMITNKQVKDSLAKLISGSWILEKSTIPFVPTIDVVNATYTTKTADYTVTVADLALPTVFNNTGDTGTQVLTLPAVAEAEGKVIKVALTAAQIVRLLPQTGEAINLNGSAVVTKYLNVAGVIGNFVECFCDGTQWVVSNYAGVVTKEA